MGGEPPDAHDAARPAGPIGAPPRLSTRGLFAPGEREVRIDHDGVEYRLRITRSNKLILFR